MKEAKHFLLIRLENDSDQYKEGQQALHEELAAQVHDLSLATHTKLADLERSTKACARCAHVLC
jgi:hypothetical protein